MLKHAYQNGVEAASKHFGVRHASALPDFLQTALTLVGAGAARNIAKAVAPNAIARVNGALSAAQELPANLLRQHVLPARDPATAFTRHLNAASAPPFDPRIGWAR